MKDLKARDVEVGKFYADVDGDGSYIVSKSPTSQIGYLALTWWNFNHGHWASRGPYACSLDQDELFFPPCQEAPIPPGCPGLISPALAQAVADPEWEAWTKAYKPVNPCQCGASSCGAPYHSPYCPLANTSRAPIAPTTGE
jgi:hypothetical protein